MKVLLVNGSPHAKGCTYTALQEAAGALNRQGIETEIFWVGIDPIAGCIGCGACVGVCPVGALELDDEGKSQCNEDLCIDCQSCVGSCPVEAIAEAGDKHEINADACIDCGACADTCPVGAIEA